MRHEGGGRVQRVQGLVAHAHHLIEADQHVLAYGFAAKAAGDAFAKSTEAGLKYFVLGALSSGMLLYGASLIYGFTGTVEFAGIAAAVKTGSVGIVFGLGFATMLTLIVTPAALMLIEQGRQKRIRFVTALSERFGRRKPAAST